MKTFIFYLCVNRNPACLVSTGNEYYTSSTTGWGCPPMKNKLGEMYNYESNFSTMGNKWIQYGICKMQH